MNTVPKALPELDVCQRARQSRDPRFDGRFFIGVLTTGIYCRTTCPARMPKEENVRYYATAASAQDSGFRPCRRCRPEAAQRLPEWTLGSQSVLRALRMIEGGYLNARGVADLAAELQVGERQLNRMFATELGTSPKSIARVCRAKLAKQLLLASDMKLTDVAYHAGYGSISRFNSEIKTIFKLTPKEIRRGTAVPVQSHVRVHLPTRKPYDFDWMFSYLQLRALPGVERVVSPAAESGSGWCYQRKLPGTQDLWLIVREVEAELQADVPVVDEPLHSLLGRIRRVFDLNADGETIHQSLQDDELLGPWVQARPGLRVPGAWDGFETAVRAVLGQQVSVLRGTELAGKMVAAYGDGLFPSPEVVARQDVAEMGMPGRRGRAISTLAAQVARGELLLDDTGDYQTLQQQLESLDGIGPWTANYIRMRVCKDPDAFPDNDWVVMKALNCTASQARKRAQVWRPWRAYALMYLWLASPELRKKQ